MAQQLSLPDLKGFAARLHLAVLVSSQPLQQSDRRLVSSLLAYADNLSRRTEEGLAEAFAFLARKTDELIEDNGVTEQTPLWRSLRDVRDNFLELSSQASALGAEQSTDRGIACGIRPVFDLCAHITEWVQTRLSRYSVAPDPPQITLATTHRGWGYDQRVMQKFSLSGWARVAQALNACTVGLNIREFAFDWPQYCLLPYVLLHEILCHGFQGLDGGRPRRDALYNCAWSEGWMDRLAMRLAEEWIVEEGSAFNIVSRCQRDEAVTLTHNLHDARYEFEDPPALCTFGRTVFDQVQDSYGAPVNRRKTYEQPIARFSLRFNTMTVPTDERRIIVDRLHVLVQAGRTEQAQRACGSFIARGDVVRLKSALAA